MGELIEHIITVDAKGNFLVGEKSYVFHLPPDIPAKEFWSVIVYNKQSNTIIKNDQLWPSVFRTSKGLLVNPDSSVDIWFGPTEPAGKEKNWIQTIPGKEWTMTLRLYGTLASWFDQTWKIGNIVPV